MYNMVLDSNSKIKSIYIRRYVKLSFKSILNLDDAEFFAGFEEYIDDIPWSSEAREVEKFNEQEPISFSIMGNRFGNIASAKEPKINFDIQYSNNINADLNRRYRRDVDNTGTVSEYDSFDYGDTDSPKTDKTWDSWENMFDDDTSLGTKSKASNGYEGETDSIESGRTDPRAPYRKYACINNRCTEVSNLYSMSTIVLEGIFIMIWFQTKYNLFVLKGHVFDKLSMQ